MPGDPSTDYFSPERLERLKGLRKRFPHWCIDWPSAAKVVAVTTPSDRLSLAVEEMRNDLVLWEKPPFLGDDVQCATWMEEDTVVVSVVELEYADQGVAQLDVDVPVAHQALFASMTHTLPYRSSIERDDRIRREWLRQIEEILLSDPRHSEKIGKLLKLAAEARRKSALAAQANQGEKDKRQARSDAAADRLKSHWHAIGQEIGLIPSRRGGKADLIPDSWIYDLSEQAEALLDEVRAYAPNDGEMQAVRALLLSDPYPAGSQNSLNNARECVRRGKACEGWDNEVHLDDWCLRLAFPMLTAEELCRREAPGWRWLPANRLRMSEIRLSQRNSRYRRSS